MTARSHECRLCLRLFRRDEEIVDIFSDTSKAEEIAPKIMITLSILVTEHDPGSNLICKECYGCVQVFSGFASRSHGANFKLVNRLISDPANSQFKKEVNTFIKMPIHRLWFTPKYSISKLYNAVDIFMQQPKDDQEPLNMSLFEEGPSIQQPCSSINSLTNGAYENNCVTTNGSSSKSSALDKNLPPNKSNKILSVLLKAKKNNRKSRKNLPSVVETTNNDHDYVANNNIQVKTNGINVNEDVICLDDEDDDDIQFIDSPNINKYSNKSRIQMHRKLQSIHHFDQNAPSTSRWLNTKDILTNDSAENMTVTPDIALPNNDSTSTLIQPKLPIYYLMPDVPELTESSLVTPQTGFHFLYEARQTVDLTEMAEENPTKKPSPLRCKRKIKKDLPKSAPPSKKKFTQTSNLLGTSQNTTYHPPQVSSTLNTTEKKKFTQTSNLLGTSQNTTNHPPQVSSTLNTTVKKKCTQTSNLPGTSQNTTNQPPQVSSTLNTTEKPTDKLLVSNGRPKRASTLGIKMHKLQALHDFDGCKASVVPLDLPLYQCPICEKIYETPEHREKHEATKHPRLPSYTDSSDDSYPNLENETGSGQQEFLVCLNLVKKGSNELKAIKRLAKRKHLMKGLVILGNDPGLYECHVCSYKTKLRYILWAHVSSNHSDLDSDSRSSPYCFQCNRFLSKRSKLLKHLDKCTGELAGVLASAPTIEKINCDHCGKEMNSLAELENHIWEQASM